MATVLGRLLDRTPFLVNHEAVEYDDELSGASYSAAHYKKAEPAEHAMLLRHLKLVKGTAEADRAVHEYEQSYAPDLRWAAGIRDPRLPPNLFKRPEEHPHTVEQRRLAREVGV